MSRNAQSYPEAGIIFIFNEATEYLVKSYSRCKRERRNSNSEMSKKPVPFTSVFNSTYRNITSRGCNLPGTVDVHDYNTL